MCGRRWWRLCFRFPGSGCRPLLTSEPEDIRMGSSPGNNPGQRIPKGPERRLPFPDSLGLSPRERKCCQPSIFRAAGFQNALIEMKFLRGGRAEFEVAALLDGGMQGFESARRVESREREMRREGAFLARDAKRSKSRVDCGGQRGEIRPGFDAGPEHARAAIIRKKSQAAKIHGDGSAAGKGRKRCLHCFTF